MDEFRFESAKSNQAKDCEGRHLPRSGAGACRVLGARQDFQLHLKPPQKTLQPATMLEVAEADRERATILAHPGRMHHPPRPVRTYRISVLPF